MAPCGSGVCRSPSPAIFAASLPGSSIPAAKRGSATSSSASCALSGGQVDRLLDDVFLRFRTRHGNIASVLDENYRTAMAMIGLVGRFLAQSTPAHRGLLDRGVLDRVGGAVQSVDRPASRPAGPSRRRGAVHHESPGDGRGARILDRFPHRSHLLRSPDPDRSRAAASPGPVRIVPDKQYEKALFRRKLKDIGVYEEVADLVLDRLADSFTSAQLEHAITEARAAASEKLQSRNRFRTFAGWPARTTSWSFPGMRRCPRW